MKESKFIHEESFEKSFVSLLLAIKLLDDNTWDDIKDDIGHLSKE